MSTSGQERRRSPRVAGRLPVKIHQNGEELVTETRNISSSGVYCAVRRYLSPMTKVQITLLLPVQGRDGLKTRKVECAGVVVRIEPMPPEEANGSQYLAAIFFNDISRTGRKWLTAFVDQHLDDPHAA